jgi:hypothetical protein
MRKLLVITLPALAVAALAFGATAGAKGTRSVKFTDTVVGASISDTQGAMSLHDSRLGNGAAVQTIKVTPTGGTDTTVAYFKSGSATSTDTFTIGQADANGNAALTGTGKDVKGTGKLKGITSTYTFSGTYNVNTTRFTVKLSGTYKLPK